MAKSLMEGIEKGPAPSAKRASKGGDTGKLVFAVLLFLLAAGVFAWYQGWIFSSPPAPQMSAQEQAQQQKDFAEQQKHTEQLIKSGTAKVGGSS